MRLLMEATMKPPRAQKLGGHNSTKYGDLHEQLL